MLVIVVVNVPSNAPTAARRRTQRLYQDLLRTTAPYNAKPHGIDYLIVDRCTADREIPYRQGVGLARKIGADIACALIARGKVRSPWIFTTDADAQLPGTYFSQRHAAGAAIVMPFCHRSSDNTLRIAARRYDWHLAYYVSGLHWAGSPYAYFTLGSTIAVDSLCYAQVRGVAKRNAGEDFHLLAKLAKVGPIHSVATPVIELLARPSARVPFGTGPRLAALSVGDPMLSYPWRIFELLKHVVVAIDHAEGKPWPDLPRANKILSALGFFDFFHPARQQHRAGGALTLALHQWFDALKTLRFVHLALAHQPKETIEACLAARFGTHDSTRYTTLLRRSLPVPRTNGIVTKRPATDHRLLAQHDRA